MWLPGLSVASGHRARAPPTGCVRTSRNWGCDFCPAGPGSGCHEESLPGPWRDLDAPPGLLLAPPLSVLPKRIVEETPSPNTETQDETAPGEVTLDRPQTSATLQAQSPGPEKVLSHRPVGLLIAAIVVLIAGVVTA